MWSNTATLQTEADEPRRTNLYQNMVPNPPLLPSAVSKLGSINRNKTKSIKVSQDAHSKIHPFLLETDLHSGRRKKKEHKTSFVTPCNHQ
jgi:hypothetical protein